MTTMNRTIQQFPTGEDGAHSSLILQLATVADDITPWGTNLTMRDRQLRSFWPTEPVLASAVYTVVSRVAAFGWTLDGPPRTVSQAQNILLDADLGRGWQTFLTKLAIDLYTQDNGAFIEVIRAGASAESPVLGLAHLDSGRCVRTGNPDFPVVYLDRSGGRHKLAAHQVIPWTEFASPIETMNGAQLSAVSRVLRAAQLLRDISVYQREKVAGTNPAAVHLVSGVSSGEITDAMAQHRDAAKQQGLARYMLPVVMASLDPTATVSHAQIDLASLPDNFDLEQSMRWYINQLALGFGVDYQDFAPLPGSGLGTGAQSLVLAMKARGKGPALFTKSLEHLLNYHGVLPRSVTFRFDELDDAAELESAQINKLRAETRQIYLTTGVLTIEAARQELVDSGELDQELFDAMQTDVSEDVQASDEERVENKAAGDFAEDERVALERELATTMEQALRSLFAELRRRLREEKGLFRQKAGPDEVFNDRSWWDRARDTLVRALVPFARRIPLDAAEVNRALGLNVNLDLINEQVLAFTSDYVNTWWSEVEGVTRAGLQEALTAWQASGLGDQGLPDLVDAIEPLFGEGRAQRIAVTEVTRLFDEGNRLAHEAAGIEEEEWQTSKDELVCSICAPLDGNRYPTKSGPRPVDDTHVNCRCARLPTANNRVIRTRAIKTADQPATAMVKEIERDDHGRITRIVERTL